jgi:hypothetical protein
MCQRDITDVRTPAQSRTARLLHPVRWDMPPVLMSIPGFDLRRGRRVCRINEPAPPGHSCRLKQKKEKGAVRRCRVQSESSLLHRKHRRVRPHHHAQTVHFGFWLAVNWSFKTVQISRRTKARRRQGNEPAPRVKQRVKIKMSRSQSRKPQEMQAGRNGNPAKRRPRGRVCCLGCEDVAMRASQRCVHSSILIYKKIQTNARSQVKDK